MCVLKKITLYILIGLSWHGVAAQSPASDVPISLNEKSSIIQNIIQQLTEHYVDTSVAAIIGKNLWEKNRKGAYDKVTSSLQFSDVVTKDLRILSKDEHLGLVFSKDTIRSVEPKEPTTEERERFRRFAAYENYGFEKVERLPGNVGFIELNGFIRPEWGAETAIAAMKFIANTDALIIDLRYNGGGEPGLIQLISSYFFEKATHLNSIFWREGKRTVQYWTSSYVVGNKYLNKPVYLLTGKNTFSAAEDFTYSLQVQKRATVIGEKTRGGANAGKTFQLTDHFEIFIPVGKAINPISNKNWEGGIMPDISASFKEALKMAHKQALKYLIEKTDSPQKKKQLESALSEL